MRLLPELASLLLTAGLAAQPAVAADVAKEIDALEARLETALAARDAAALEPLLADPFTWVHASDGRVDSRATWIAAAARGLAVSGQRSTRTEHGATLATYGGSEPHTVVRVARVRLVDSFNKRESWLRQTRTFVRGGDGKWRLAMGQGVVMYEGPPLDAALHARYAGTYVIEPGRALTLRWESGTLLATFPNGAETQIFLASPTHEATRTLGSGSLRFTLGDDGRPTHAALVRGDNEAWKATRRDP
jgi:ketosteroid isomerase-like protein